MGEIESEALCLQSLAVDLLEVRLHRSPELGEVRVRAFAVEERAPELTLEQLNSRV